MQAVRGRLRRIVERVYQSIFVLLDLFMRHARALIDRGIRHPAARVRRQGRTKWVEEKPLAFRTRECHVPIFSSAAAQRRTPIRLDREVQLLWRYVWLSS